VASKFIIGIDEVGRGPLAGPMMVGAVAIAGEPSAAHFLEGIKDSKKLSKKKREEWSKKIWDMKENRPEVGQLWAGNIKIAIVSIAPSVIDKYGISKSLKLAVAKCLKILLRPDDEYEIILDGSLYAPPEYRNQQTIIRGDEKIPIISAASVVAKVYRDNMMQKLHKKYPEYGFDAHKGYGTAAHIAAIKKYGLSQIHRKSFCRNFI
jgi:ribonuclease HII